MKIRAGSHIIEITHPDKILFPKTGIAKQEIVEYYAKIAPIMISYTKNRALTMLRYPSGIGEEGFYHKDAPEYFPAWIKRVPVEKQEGGVVHYVVCDTAATLVYLANYGCLTPHLWLSKIDKPYFPDQMFFDLDPSREDDFAGVKRVAFKLKVLLEDRGLVPFVKTTGSHGVHVVVPIKRTQHFDAVRAYAHAIAQQLVDQDPQFATLEMHKTARAGRIFIDVLRNSFSATAVAPYAVRVHEGAPVATPITWEELEKLKASTAFTIKNIFKLLDARGDVWQDMRKFARVLGGYK